MQMQKRTKILIPVALAALVIVGTFASLTLADNTQATVSNLQVGNMFLIQSTTGYVLPPNGNFSLADNAASINTTTTNGNMTKPSFGDTLRLSFSLLINITTVNPTNATYRILTGEMTLGPLGVGQIHGRGMIAKFSNDTRIRMIGEGWNARLGSVRFFFIGHFVSTTKGLMLQLIGLVDTRYDALLTARAAFLKSQPVTQPLFP